MTLNCKDFKDISIKEGELPLNTLITNMPDNVYHDQIDWAYSSSQLKEASNKLPHFDKIQNGIAKAYPEMYSKSRSLDLGSATHLRILQPELFEKQVVVAPFKTARSGAFQTFIDKHPDKLVITENESRDINAFVTAFQSSIAGPYINDHPDSMKEVSLFVKEGDIYYKTKMDIYNPTLNIIMDLKTSSGCVYTDVRNACYKYGYHFSACMYLWALYKAKNISRYYWLSDKNDTKFIFSFIDKKKIACQSYVMHSDLLVKGRDAFSGAKGILKYYLNKGIKNKKSYEDSLKENIIVKNSLVRLPSIGDTSFMPEAYEIKEKEKEKEDEWL